jgi:hypothetical protein
VQRCCRSDIAQEELVRSAVISAFRTPDLRRKILFVLGIIILYRLGATIPSPGVDYQQVQQCLDDVSRGDSAGIYSLINTAPAKAAAPAKAKQPAKEEKPKDNSPANAFDLLGEAEA